MNDSSEKTPSKLCSPNRKSNSWLKVSFVPTHQNISKNSTLIHGISKILRIWRHFQEFYRFQEFDVISRKNFSIDLLSYHVLLIQSWIFGQKFRSFENLEISKNWTWLPRNLEIPRIWRHFLEKFFDRPPIVSCSPNTKWNFWTKIFLSLKEFRNIFSYISRLLFRIWKNVSNKSRMV